MFTRARIPLVASALGAWLVLGSAGGAAPPSQRPTATARAFAVAITIPGQASASTQVVAAPPHAQAFLDGFRYPADGSAVSTGAVSVSASATPGATAVAQATSDVAAVSLLGGELTADGVAGRAHASAGAQAVTGDVAGSGVTNLVVLGQPVAAAPGLRVALADWGYAIVLAQGADTTAQAGRKGNRSFVTPLEVHVTADHGGLPAGSVIQVGYAEAAGQSAPPAPRPEPKPKPPPKPGPSTAMHDERANVRSNKGIDLKVLAHQRPLGFQPKLTAGGYVFPVYGAVSYGDSYGGPRGDVSGGWHHGDDLFGQVGQPILAVADGTLFQVGRIKIGGNRLWLRDRQGNQFYYAHLSAYSAAARNGAHVKAGAVIGFMGTTGDAFGTPAHLHFEIHPVSLLFLDYDGAVDPTAYLDAWRRQEDLTFPSIAGWAPAGRGSVRAPEPGAILLGSSDISSADGLDPGSLQRALRTPARPSGGSALDSRATPPAQGG